MSLRGVTRRWVGMLALAGAGCCFGANGTTEVNGTYTATAYAQQGVTASGQLAHTHVVAADPDILPIGSRIKVRHAGRYSGEYVVADTGEKIQGRKIDIFIPSVVACKKFGTKPVTVTVLSLGDGTHAAAKQADQAVKQDVKQDLAQKTAGNAATEADLAAKGTAASSATSTVTRTTTSKTTSTSTSTDH